MLPASELNYMSYYFAISVLINLFAFPTIISLHVLYEIREGAERIINIICLQSPVADFNW